MEISIPVPRISLTVPKIVVQGDIVREYEESITLLNGLRNYSQDSPTINNGESYCKGTAGAMRTLGSIGISMEELDALSVIHIGGSKGKGMTATFTESILRRAGLRTGFFSSPHLVAARERIRINGKSLSRKMFANYFSICYNNFTSSKSNIQNEDIPGYFTFLTCMAIYIFLKEKVDVVIMEVGRGGKNDPTNVIRAPIVVGISSIEEADELSDSNTSQEAVVNDIAGIMKIRVPVFTVHSHSVKTLEILKSISVDLKSFLYVAYPWEKYKEEIKLGVDDGNVCRTNASLAVQLSNYFLETQLNKTVDKSNYLFTYLSILNSPLLPCITDGLALAKCPGRFQILKWKENMELYIDGADTEASLKLSTNWFVKNTSDKSLRILIFHPSGETNFEKLLQPMAACSKFGLTIFCPPVVYSANTAKSDRLASVSKGNRHIETCKELKRAWKIVAGSNSKVQIFRNTNSTVKFLDILLENLGRGNVDDELINISVNTKVNILITGSLQLVGSFVSFLDPDMR